MIARYNTHSLKWLKIVETQGCIQTEGREKFVMLLFFFVSLLFLYFRDDQMSHKQQIKSTHNDRLSSAKAMIVTLNSVDYCLVCASRP